MRNDNLKNILSRAILDQEFRALLFENLHHAVEEYDLNQEELSKLKSIDEEAFNSFCDELFISIILGEKGNKKLPLLLV